MHFRDFFISHASDDEDWALWIARELSLAGYSIELDLLEWAPGQDFVEAMELALEQCRNVISLYSPAYFTRPYAQLEHRAAINSAIAGRSSQIIPVIIKPCEIPSLYATLIHTDISGLDEVTASNRLIQSVTRVTQRPATSDRIIELSSLPVGCQQLRSRDRHPRLATYRQRILSSPAEAANLPLWNASCTEFQEVVVDQPRIAGYQFMDWEASGSLSSRSSTFVPALVDIEFSGGFVPVA